MSDSIDFSRYRVLDSSEPFAHHIGPFYFKIDGDTRTTGAVHCVLPTEPRHANDVGGIHGGAILTLADYALCRVAARAAERGTTSSFALTVSIAVKFLSAGRIGAPLEAAGEPLQVTGRLAFARGSITQEDQVLALWSGAVRHMAYTKVVGRKEAKPSSANAKLQTVPDGFELPAGPCCIYSRHIGPSYVRPEVNGATLIQPTLPHMCNLGGMLQGGYMMGFAESAIRRAASMVTGMVPSTVSFAAEFLSAGEPTSPLMARAEVPRNDKTLAFLRGLLEQNGKPLLSYSATALLRPPQPRLSMHRRRAPSPEPYIVSFLPRRTLGAPLLPWRPLYSPDLSFPFGPHSNQLGRFPL